jgi:hypothetical protein
LILVPIPVMKMFSPQKPVQERQTVVMLPDVFEIDLERW